ncbi:MAG: PKD domain-containing protein, partial [Owenweeksia sp.]
AAATASFIHNNNALNVSFNSSGSTGNSLIWDFGDGSPLSTMANPSHTYGSAGQYTVSLISLNRCGESDTLIQVIDVCDTLSAGNFTITQNGTTVTLTPSGSVGANSFMWDMGDGFTFSSTSGVSHTYMNSGTYTITLVAFNICGETDTIVQTIDLCDVLSAAFNYQQAANTVVFDGSISSSGATAFFWTLGDGSVATGANYTHTYTNLGNYYVTLLVVNACMDSAWYSDTIKLCTPAVPSWTYTITSSGSAGMVVQFDGSASQNAISYQWDFGDGTSGSGVAPQHTYTTVSLTYLVKLTVTNDCGEQESYAYRLNQIGLEELEAGQRIEFYPNPVKDKLTFKWQAENNQLKEVKIFNNSGQLMLLKELPQTKEGEMSYGLNVSQLAKGLYILQLTGDNMNIRELLII